MSCAWSEDEDGVWHTACSNAFVFESGTPIENQFKFCAYCGFSLLMKQYVPVDREEDEECTP